MGRTIYVTISNGYTFDEQDILEAYVEEGRTVDDNELLELAEQLVDTLDSTLVLDTAFVEATFV
jgi:hypothetical protein